MFSHFKVFIVISVVFVLHSCTNTAGVPPTDKNTDPHITIGRGSNMDNVASMTSEKIITATGKTATGAIVSVSTGVVYSSGLQDVIKLQLKKGPEVIMEIDCNKFTGESKKYCDSQQKEINDRKNELNWQNVLKMGPDYIRTFDCKRIVSIYGQGYCREYQLNLK